jgi:hypothetical protein
MKRGRVLLGGLAVGAVLALGQPVVANETGGAARCVGTSPTLAAAYNEAFGRSLGNWQAGDATRSYPLPDGTILWILNDSFINDKNPNGAITKDSTFVHNVAVKQTDRCFEVVAGLDPPPPPALPPGVTTTMPFIPTSTPKPASFLATGETDKQWWWFHGGDIEGDYLHVFITDMQQVGVQSWEIRFQPSSIAIATYNWRTLELIDIRPAPNAGVTPGYGFSVANDERYTYLFGHNDNLQFTKGTRENYVARVPLHRVFDVPSYWNGASWVADASQAVSVSTQGSWDHRMTVMHQDDRWLATAKEDDFFGDEFLILEAPEAQGPWVITQRIPIAPLTNPADGVTYDGTAIPRIVDGKIIIGWSNNQYDFARVAPQPRLYRPSFADIAIGPPTQSNAICHGDQVGRSGQLRPSAPSRYLPLAPRRVLDTRDTSSVLQGDAVRSLNLASALGRSPGSFTAAVLNVTMVDAIGEGFMTVWPSGSDRPQASNLNSDHAGSTTADLVTTAVGADGVVQIYTSIATHVIVDVAGIYEPAATSKDGRFQALAPSRLLDTRDLGPRLSAKQTTLLGVSGKGGLPPTGVSAVVVNLTSTAATTAGFVTAWAEGSRPTASNLNVERGSTRANQVIVPVSADGTIQLYNDASMHLIVDVTGYFTSAEASLSDRGLFVSTVPMRLLDSRDAPGRPGTGCVARIVVPATASAAVTTLTIADARKAGYATMWPGSQGRPTTSSLNLDGVGQTRPNHAVTGLDSSQALQVYVEPKGHVIVDLAGYYT